MLASHDVAKKFPHHGQCIKGSDRCKASTIWGEHNFTLSSRSPSPSTHLNCQSSSTRWAHSIGLQRETYLGAESIKQKTEDRYRTGLAGSVNFAGHTHTHLECSRPLAFASLLASCIQPAVSKVDTAHRRRRPIRIPHFRPFLPTEGVQSNHIQVAYV